MSALFFRNSDNQGLRWDGDFLLLTPHPQNGMNKSSILALVSITLVDWSYSDQVGMYFYRWKVENMKWWITATRKVTIHTFINLCHWLSRKSALENPVTAQWWVIFHCENNCLPSEISCEKKLRMFSVFCKTGTGK